MSSLNCLLTHCLIEKAAEYLVSQKVPVMMRANHVAITDPMPVVAELTEPTAAVADSLMKEAMDLKVRLGERQLGAGGRWTCWSSTRVLFIRVGKDAEMSGVIADGLKEHKWINSKISTIKGYSTPSEVFEREKWENAREFGGSYICVVMTDNQAEKRQENWKTELKKESRIAPRGNGMEPLDRFISEPFAQGLRDFWNIWQGQLLIRWRGIQWTYVTFGKVGLRALSPDWTKEKKEARGGIVCFPRFYDTDRTTDVFDDAQVIISSRKYKIQEVGSDLWVSHDGNNQEREYFLFAKLSSRRAKWAQAVCALLECWYVCRHIFRCCSTRFYI